MIVAPFFGSKTPASIKTGLLVVMTIVFLPHLAVTSQTLVGFNFTFILLCVKELFLGFILGFFASAPFWIAESSGIYIDFLRGASSLQVTDPSTQSQSSDIGVLYNYVMLVIFYQIDGPLYFFSAVMDSYTLIPADGWISPQFFNFYGYFWNTIWAFVNTIVSIGLQLAAPCLLSILMTEVFLGIANRLAPQVQIAFLGMSLKSLAGLAMLCAAWFFILKQMGQFPLYWIKELTKLIQSIH